MNHQSKQNTVGKFYNQQMEKGGANGDVVQPWKECTSAQKQELAWNYLRIEFLFFIFIFGNLVISVFWSNFQLMGSSFGVNSGNQW